MESFILNEKFATDPETLYRAWLDSKIHADFTGYTAQIEPVVNGKFIIWDNYISGKTQKLEPFKKIVQLWRTTEFPEDSPDSVLELKFEEIKGGTKLILSHSNIPDGQGKDYKKGWKEFYFEPMKEYFS